MGLLCKTTSISLKKSSAHPSTLKNLKYRDALQQNAGDLYWTAFWLHANSRFSSEWLSRAPELLVVVPEELRFLSFLRQLSPRARNSKACFNYGKRRSKMMIMTTSGSWSKDCIQKTILESTILQKRR